MLKGRIFLAIDCFSKIINEKILVHFSTLLFMWNFKPDEIYIEVLFQYSLKLRFDTLGI